MRIKSLIASLLFSVLSIAQGTWSQKANFGGTTRYGAIGFSIGSKGYVGTGFNGSTYYNDLWEYDPSLNTWTQKASFAGTPRAAASGFSIGAKGYIIMGAPNGTFPTLQDIWEYNPSTNSWNQKANFPGSARYGAAGFAIGSKGYICCGNKGSATGPFTNELWEFDPSTNTWTQKTNFPGTARYGLTQMGWAIGGKAYLGFGVETGSSWPSDFYEYDPASDSWTKKKDFPLTGRSYGVAFASCNNYYVGMGQHNGIVMSDVWKYDPSTDNWIQVTNFGGGNRWIMASCVINGVAYCGTGYNSPTYYNDWWEYTCCTPPTLSTSQNNFSCNGSNNGIATINVTSSGIPPYTYLWNTIPIQTTQSATGLTSGSYIVRVTDANGCSNNATTTITAFPTPNSLLTNENNVTISADSTITLSASGANSYSWNTGETTSSISVSPAFSTTYTVIGTDANGCTETATISVFIPSDNCTLLQETFFIPNVFSPNDDGENDDLRLFYTIKVSCIKEFELAIFNRWGEKVFETFNIYDSWDGTYRGQKMNEAVFYYYCKITSITDEQIIKKGNITILR